MSAVWSQALSDEERSKVAHGGHSEMARTHRWGARIVVGDLLFALAMRSDLCAMSTKQFDDFWKKHRLS